MFKIKEIDRNAVKYGYKILTVRSVIWQSPSIFELRLERNGIDFLPGDCVSIFTADNASFREYSISTGINDPYLGFLIKHMGNGTVTHYLSELKPGDKIKLTEPYGAFHPGLQNQNNPFVFIATGTGIAPFLSYLRSYPHKPPQTFLYGVNIFEDAVGYTLFSHYCDTHLAISKEQTGDFHFGRLSGLLHHLPLQKNIHYYLCGLDAMIEDVSSWLKSNGIHGGHIHHEIFFHASQASG